MHKNFRKDLIEGNKVEEQFVKRIRLKYGAYDIEKSSGVEQKFWDVRFKNERGMHSVEIKADFMATETGNAAIEFECRGNPSGISITKADWWVMKFGTEFWGIKTEELRKLIEDSQWFRLIQRGGDYGSNTKMYLFKLDFLKERMIRI